MTKANECTCPSGDGSLRHPCPAHPALVEQAGGDERAAFRPAQVISYRPGVGEVTIYVAGRVPGYMNIGDTVYVSDRAPVEQPIAALAQPSPVSEALIYACKNLAQITSSDGSGHADIALAVLRMAGVGDDERERLVNEWKAARAWKPSPAQAEAERPPQPERYTADVFHPERPYYMAQTSVVRASDFDEFATQYERIVGALRAQIAEWQEAAGRGRSDVVAYIAERAKLLEGRDAALAKVAGLELKLDQSDYAYDNDRCHMRGLAKQAAEAIQVFTGHDSSANLAHRYGEKWWEHLDELRDALLAFAKNAPVAQPEEMPGEILAAKLIETWVTKHGKPAPWSTAVEITAVATNMPNDERDRLLALDDDVDAQAQHSVPGKYDDVLLPFLKSMEHELHANAGKGDRPGWLQMDRRTALLEIYYHLAKLQKATKDNDAAGIVEYAADVANMSMMLVDVCGLLAAAPGKEEV